MNIIRNFTPIVVQAPDAGRNCCPRLGFLVIPLYAE